jgi:hypothetical protein
MSCNNVGPPESVQVILSLRRHQITGFIDARALNRHPSGVLTSVSVY